MSVTKMETSMIPPTALIATGLYSSVQSARIGIESVPGEDYSAYVYAHCLTLFDEPEPTRWHRRAWAWVARRWADYTFIWLGVIYFTVTDEKFGLMFYISIAYITLVPISWMLASYAAYLKPRTPDLSLKGWMNTWRIARLWR